MTKFTYELERMDVRINDVIKTIDEVHVLLETEECDVIG